MRKLYSVLLGIVMVLQMCAVTGFAASSTVTVAEVSGKQGETVNVTVDLADCAGFANLALEFGYDSSVLTLEGVTNSVAGAVFNKAPSLEKNPYNVTWNATENVVHSGTLVTLQFKIADDAVDGIYPVTVDFYKGPIGTSKDGITVNYDENLESIGLSYVSGSVMVGDGTPDEPQSACVKVNTANANAGETVDVTVDLTDCAGFINLGLEFGYDSSVLTLEGVTNSVVGASFTKAPSFEKNPYNMTWNSTENMVHSGTLVTLQFKIADYAKGGIYPVTVDYYKGPNGTSKDGITVNYDENFKSIGLSYISGSVMVGDVSLDEPQGAYVKVNSARAKAGDTVDVVVELTNCEGFVNLGLEFGYDSSVLTLEGVTNSVAGAMFNKSPNLEKIPYNMTWNTTENLVHSGALVTLHFKVTEGAAYGSYPVVVDYYKGPNGTSKDGVNVNYDENLESIGLSYVSGTVIVKPQDYTMSATKTEDGVIITAEAPDEMNGIFVAAVYEDKKLLEAQILDADYSTDVTFVSSGDTVKVMWLESITSLKALCNSVQF